MQGIIFMAEWCEVVRSFAQRGTVWQGVFIFLKNVNI